MPRYDEKGSLVQPGFYNQLKMQEAETGAFKIKLKLPINNHNMVSHFSFIVYFYSICTKK